MCNPFTLSCKNDHARTFNPTALEDFITSGEFGCDECENSLGFDSPSTLVLECHVCSMTFKVCDPEEAQDTMELGCQGCEGRGFDGQSIHVRRSFQFRAAEYEWMRSGKTQRPLRRPGRTDYWEGVIHFCTADEFASIHRDGRIKAGPTGFFNVPAVCLSEATEGGWAELRKRHGDFGYVFHKRDLLALGGAPVLYLPESLLNAQRAKGFADPLKPFVNVIRTPATSPRSQRHDFLFEREWRMPSDIIFSQLPPYAVIAGHFDASTSGWYDIFSALMSDEELDIEGGERND